MIEDGNITGGGVGNVDEHWLRWGDYNWFTPLFGACQSSSLAKVKILLDRCQQSNNSFAKGACHNGMSAIHFALASQHPTAASIVTCLSAHLDHRYLSEYREEKTGYTLLHRAAQEASLSSFRRVLSSFNVPPNVRGSLDGKTALHVAISPEVDRGSTEMTLVVKMLLRYGVDCELRESIYGDTALLHAVRVFADGGAWSCKVEEVSSSVRSGQPHGMLASLLDHGADREVVSLVDGSTALDLVKKISNERIRRKGWKVLQEYESMKEYQRKKRGGSTMRMDEEGSEEGNEGSGSGARPTRVSPRKNKKRR